MEALLPNIHPVEGLATHYNSVTTSVLPSTNRINISLMPDCTNIDSGSTHYGVPMITATPVAIIKRLEFLPALFGPKLMLRAEQLLFTYAERLAPESYRGGLWEFYDLSNGGGFAAPTNPLEWNLMVDGNGFEGDMSAQAAGIVFTLFALNQLIHECHARNDAMTDKLLNHYEQLRDFAAEHGEASSIYRAID